MKKKFLAVFIATIFALSFTLTDANACSRPSHDNHRCAYHRANHSYHHYPPRCHHNPVVHIDKSRPQLRVIYTNIRNRDCYRCSYYTSCDYDCGYNSGNLYFGLSI